MPNGFYLRETFKEFLKHPVDSGLLFLINSVCRWKAKRQEPKLNAKWQVATTTKKLV